MPRSSFKEYLQLNCPKLHELFEAEYQRAVDTNAHPRLIELRDRVIERHNLSQPRFPELMYQTCGRWEKELEERDAKE